MALSQPGVALTRSRLVLADRPSHRDASVAHQAIGIVMREDGDVRTSLRHLRAALRHAEHCDDERLSDVLATLGGTLQYAGRTAESMRVFERAEPLTPPHRRPRLLLRRAHALCAAGRYDEALVDLDRALPGHRRLGDELWEARTLNNRCVVRLALGDVRRAGDDARAAESLYRRGGHDLEATQARHNQAVVALLGGDVPTALGLLDDVTRAYRAHGVETPELLIDHVQALMTVGLSREATLLAEEGVRSTRLSPLLRAETLLVAARAALTADQSATARDHASSAARVFRSQHRPEWADRARLLLLQIRCAEATSDDEHPGAGPAGRRLLRDTAALVDALTTRGSADLPVARLLHGQVALATGRADDAERSLQAAASARHTGLPLTRAAGWLAAALLADHQGDRRALLAACRRGLDAVDEHRSTLGDIELRALASGHGLELAQLAVREALRSADTRLVLWWVERWRAAALQAVVAPPQDATLGGEITALRDVTRRLSAVGEEESSPALTRERARLETSVRRRYRQLRGAGAAGTSIDLRALLAGLGDTVLVTLLTIDGRLYAVTAAGGRVTRRELGSLSRAQSEAAFAGFTLRRAAYGRRVDLASSAERLQDALIGPPPAAWSAPAVVLVPPASLLSVPWGLLPVFAETSVTVAPSLTMWARATARPAPPGGRVALVTGPDLTTDQEEVTRVGDLYPRATVLGGSSSSATVERALGALDGVALAHVAAHGTFRRDAPLFSSLLLADGPLMVHDLDRLQRPPHTMILSACDSGGLSPIAADEALGLVTSLLALGTSTVLASVAPVNDRATVTVMRQVHATIAAGGTVADGLRDARRATRADVVLAATAAAFTAWGA